MNKNLQSSIVTKSVEEDRCFKVIIIIKCSRDFLVQISTRYHEKTVKEGIRLSLEVSHLHKVRWDSGVA